MHNYASVMGMVAKFALNCSPGALSDFLKKKNYKAEIQC